MIIVNVIILIYIFKFEFRLYSMFNILLESMFNILLESCYTSYWLVIKRVKVSLGKGVHELGLRYFQLNPLKQINLLELRN